MSFEIPLSHIAEIIMGQSPKCEEVNNEGIGLPLLNGPTEFTDRYPAPVQHTAYAKKISLPGDILFCVRGSTTGRMNYSDQKYCIGRGLAAIRGRNGYPTPYVKSVLETYLPKLLAAATGSTFPNVSKDLINNIPVSVLPVENACNISKLIELQEEKVFTNNQINQTLEQMAQALFKSWFVDFEPVKAKMTVLAAGGSQEEATLAAMTAISGKNADALAVFEREHPEQYAELKATAELFPSAMQDSELGEIPAEWSYKPISQIVMVKSGYAFKSKSFTDSGFPVIKIKNIIGDGTVDVDDCQYVSSETVQGLNRFVIKNGDVLLAMTGATVGKVGVFVNNGSPAYLNQRVAKFECRKELICNWFVYNIVSRSDFTSKILSTAQGSAQPNISAKEIESIARVIPLDSLIIAYEKCVSKLYQFVMCNISKNSLLTQLRDTLLPKLLSGEITLPEAEQIISEEA
ncbi:restriction endonuclease subunit S [Klebsiella variicola]|uniref:restriction endonuclease subunit S n=1 Tax=Klebsiella variicola TaxID=244366 RepID=UPI0034DFC60F